jgi:proline iminopeptidase
MKHFNKFLFSLLFSTLVTVCVYDHAHAGGSYREEWTAGEIRSTEGYLQIEGVDLFYKVIGEGEPIVIVHGGPGLHHGYLMSRLPELSSEHRLVFYDQRGSGKSIPTPLNAENINMGVFVEDLERLRTSLGLEKISLLGHSWGGFLAMHYAIEHPQNLDRLILMNSLPSTSRGILAFAEEWSKRTGELGEKLTSIQSSQEFANGEPQKVAEFYRLLFSTYLFDAQMIEDLPLSFESAAALSGFEVSRVFNNLLLGKEIDLRGQLEALNVPTLIVHGDHDPIPVWTAEETAASIPHAALYVIEQCGHFPDIERPDTLLPKLEEFLRR